MGKILQRLKDLAENEGITIGKLERVIGASKGVLSRAINNDTDIQVKWLEIIADNYPQYSTKWLLTGQGSMINTETPSKCSDNALVTELRTIIKEQSKEIARLELELEHYRSTDAATATP